MSEQEQGTQDNNDHSAPRTKRPYDRRELRSAPSLVLVNTGHGKGKSTAAFGTLLRSRGRDWPTAVVQFLKSGKWRTGEEAMLRQLGVEWFSAGDGFSWDSADLDESRAKAVAAWAFSRELIAAGAHRMVMLDEISYPMNWGWIEVSDVVAALRDRPEDVSVFLTGREMPEPVIEVADTVTEMVVVKHAFQQGIRARRGIDY
ncbi:cob(I)yrinic acid a,c-diamide adenosyltransferase [Ornithinimicrobium sp. Y1694]|uniref:cob(I)yrinic acid a,c-diamide adenosyltransferase n=1 Tax=Ornithinimicrobium sp. Y1694 TaxID=3418590 RepID=UPI003CF31154